MIATTAWRTDDPCPVCGTGLTATTTGPDRDRPATDCGCAVTWLGHLTGRDCNPDGWRLMTGADDPGRAARHAAGPRRHPRPRRGQRRVHPPGPAPPHRHRHRPGRPGPHPLRRAPSTDACPACAERARSLRAAAVPRRLAPRARTRPRPPAPPTRQQECWLTLRADAQAAATTPSPPARTRPSWTSSSPSWTTSITAAGSAAATAPDQTPAMPQPRTAARSTRRRQDTPDLPKRPSHRPRRPARSTPQPGRQDLPAVDVPHPHLRQLRQSRPRRHPGRPRPLRLPAGRQGRAALRGAVRPAHPEPAPLPRLRRPVLRRHRTAETTRPARPHRHPRRRLPHRPARRHRRDLPPGLVATDRQGPVPGRRAARLARAVRPLPRPRDRRAPADLGPGPRRHRPARPAAARRPVRAEVRRPGRPRPEPKTPAGASATSPNT